MCKCIFKTRTKHVHKNIIQGCYKVRRSESKRVGITYAIVALNMAFYDLIASS